MFFPRQLMWVLISFSATFVLQVISQCVGEKSSRGLRERPNALDINSISIKKISVAHTNKRTI